MTEVIAKDKAESQVNAQLREANLSFDRLTDGVNKLEDVLSSVLKDQISQETDKQQEEQALVELAAKLRNNRRIIDTTADLVYSMLDRLEL